MVRTALMFLIALGALALVAAPNMRWAPAGVVASQDVAVVETATAEPAAAAADEDLLPSYLVPVRRVAFPEDMVETAAVTPAESQEPTADPNADVRFVTADALNMRARPTAQSEVVGRLVAGAQVKVIGEDRHWLQVVSEDGQTGWISGKFVSNSRS